MENVKRIVKGRYHALADSVINSDRTEDIAITSLLRNINKELKMICSAKHSSIILDNFEAVKQFSWRSIWIELNQAIPTLMKLLTGLVSKPQNKKPMLCMVASMILKSRHSSMALAQRAVSVLLYGNGATKMVCIN